MSKKKQALVIILIALSIGIFGTNQAYADIGTTDPIYQKAFYAGVKKCFESTSSNGGLKSTITISEFDGSVSSLVENDEKIVKKIGLAEGDFSHEAASMSCKTLLSQWVANRIPVNITSDLETKKTRLENAEYSEETSSTPVTDDKCYQFAYVTNEVITGDPIPRNTVGYSNNLCIAKDASGNFVSSVVSTADGSNDVISFSKTGTGQVQLKVKIKKMLSTETKTHDYDLSSFGNEAEIFVAIGNQIAADMGSSLRNSEGGWVEYAGGLLEMATYNRYAACQAYSAVGDNGIKCESVSDETIWVTAEGLSKTFASSSDLDTTYKKHATRNMADFSAVIKNFSNEAYDYDGIKFSDDEKYSLYVYYLEDIYDVNMSNIQCADVALSGAGDYQARLWDGSKYTDYCYFNASNPDTKVNGVFDDGIFGREMNLGDIITALNGLNNSSAPNTPISTVQQNGEASASSKCSDFKGAGALGWLICPIMQWMQEAALNAYQDYVEPNLIIEPQLFATTSDTGTRQAWGIFRDMANVAFIILFLVVIFSQLTGVGIDNYGIKKILPKMIVAAVLINLSYWLCLIVIDISNIVGSGIFSLLAGLPTPEPTIDGASITPSGATGVAITAVTVLAAVAGIAAVIQNPAMLLTLLVSAVGVLISVFFLFVLLSVREAAIVVLTVVSPIAFVFYMLPNTKKYMDKWWKFLSGLLLVYPIAALLVGGGDYVSRLLLSVNADGANYMGAFIAMVVGIAPIFFIPTVLKGSFAAFGKVGTSLANLGTRASSTATSKIKSGEGYKATQVRGLERRARIKAGYNSKGQVTALGAMKAKFAGSGLGRALGYQNLQAARVATANKNRERDIQAGAELRDIDLKYQNAQNPTDEETYFARKLERARDRGDTNEMFAVIEQAKRSNMQASHIANMTRDVLGGEKLGNMSDGQRKNFLEEFGKRYGNDFLKKDFEQANWARRGGVGVTGVAALSGWAALTSTTTDPSTGQQITKRNINLDDMKDEDVAALSSDRLYELIDSGAISQSQAQRVWASNSNMDDAGRLILGAWGNDGNKINKQYAQKALSIPKNGGALTPDSNKGEKATQSIDRKQVDAWTRRAAQASVIEDVAIRNVQNGSNTQTDELKTDMGVTGASMAGSLQQIAGDTGEIRKTSATTATQTSRTADNTLRSANTTDQIYGEVQYANQQLGDISGNTERGADATELVVDHTQRTAENTAQAAANTGRTADNVDAVNKQLHLHGRASADAAAIQMDDHTLEDVATDPKRPNNDLLQQAAQREYNRRN